MRSKKVAWLGDTLLSQMAVLSTRQGIYPAGPWVQSSPWIAGAGTELKPGTATIIGLG